MPKKTPTKPSSSAAIKKNPDWSYWENLATVSLREALQLSLGLDPHSHVPASEEDMSLREQYWNRLLISKNHAIDADWVVGKVVREDGDISPEYTDVYLKKFAEWIVNDTTLDPFPEQFLKLIPSQTKANSEHLQEPLQTEQPHLHLNRDKRSQYYFATQPVSVLNDFMRV